MDEVQRDFLAKMTLLFGEKRDITMVAIVKLSKPSGGSFKLEVWCNRPEFGNILEALKKYFVVGLDFARQLPKTLASDVSTMLDSIIKTKEDAMDFAASFDELRKFVAEHPLMEIDYEIRIADDYVKIHVNGGTNIVTNVEGLENICRILLSMAISPDPKTRDPIRALALLFLITGFIGMSQKERESFLALISHLLGIIRAFEFVEEGENKSNKK